MWEAKSLYKVDDESHSGWIDVVFLISVFAVHLVYGLKFTTFSLAYLHAKCEEKQDGRKWAESKLYLHTVYADSIDKLKAGDIRHDDQFTVNAQLWGYLAPCRFIIRGLFTLCGCMVLLFWIILMVNLMFDYLIVSVVVRFGVSSLFAVMIIPFWTFVNVTFGRFLIFGIMAMWNLNVMSSLCFTFILVLCQPVDLCTNEIGGY